MLAVPASESKNGDWTSGDKKFPQVANASFCVSGTRFVEDQQQSTVRELRI